MRIGIDLMGSDRSPEVLFPAVERAFKEFPEIQFVVFVTKTSFDNILSSHPFLKAIASIEFQIVSEFIESSEEPVAAFRRKKNSSLVVGIKLLKKRYLDGFISAGNTGAFIAGVALLLPLLPGIKRPGLLASVPTLKDPVAIIDVGGNVSWKAEHLIQFAQLGIAYQRCCKGIPFPRVGLLNIGVEKKKGTSELRLAYQFLQEMAERGEIAFAGNIEGRDVFQGTVDVLVTDGFTGNVLLKTSEGAASFVLQKVKTTIPNDLFGKLQSQFDYEEYPGAIVCGIDRIAVKCHGQSSYKGLLSSIQGAIQLVKNQFLVQIKNQLSFQR